jgi:hypothetical protein
MRRTVTQSQECKMEPKKTDVSRASRLIRYGAVALVVAVVAVCACLAWYTYAVQDRNRLMCDQLVNIVLLQTHFQAWEADPVKADLVKELSTDLPTTPPFSAQVLHADGTFGDGRAADEYERQLLSRWKSNTPTGGQSDDGRSHRGGLFGSSFTYYKAVRLRDSCVICHLADAGQSTLTPQLAANAKPGDLMSIVKIKLEE